MVLGGFFFWVRVGPDFMFLNEKQGLMELKGWNYLNLIK
jgi:hypothetical protein